MKALYRRPVVPLAAAILHGVTELLLVIANGRAGELQFRGNLGDGVSAFQ
jgi:hypothetical protein